MLRQYKHVKNMLFDDIVACINVLKNIKHAILLKQKKRFLPAVRLLEAQLVKLPEVSLRIIFSIDIENFINSQLAICYRLTGNIEKSIHYNQKITKNCPEYALYILQGDTYQESSKRNQQYFSAALSSFNHAISLDANNPIAYLYRANLYLDVCKDTPAYLEVGIKNLQHMIQIIEDNQKKEGMIQKSLSSSALFAKQKLSNSYKDNSPFKTMESATIGKIVGNRHEKILHNILMNLISHANTILQNTNKEIQNLTAANAQEFNSIVQLCFKLSQYSTVKELALKSAKVLDSLFAFVVHIYAKNNNYREAINACNQAIINKESAEWYFLRATQRTEEMGEIARSLEGGLKDLGNDTSEAAILRFTSEKNIDLQAIKIQLENIHETYQLILNDCLQAEKLDKQHALAIEMASAMYNALGNTTAAQEYANKRKNMLVDAAASNEEKSILSRAEKRNKERKKQKNIVKKEKKLQLNIPNSPHLVEAPAPNAIATLQTALFTDENATNISELDAILQQLESQVKTIPNPKAKEIKKSINFKKLVRESPLAEELLKLEPEEQKELLTWYPLPILTELLKATPLTLENKKVSSLFLLRELSWSEYKCLYQLSKKMSLSIYGSFLLYIVLNQLGLQSSFIPNDIDLLGRVDQLVGHNEMLNQLGFVPSRFPTKHFASYERNLGGNFCYDLTLGDKQYSIYDLVSPTRDCYLKINSEDGYLHLEGNPQNLFKMCTTKTLEIDQLHPKDKKNITAYFARIIKIYMNLCANQTELFKPGSFMKAMLENYFIVDKCFSDRFTFNAHSCFMEMIELMKRGYFSLPISKIIITGFCSALLNFLSRQVGCEFDKRIINILAVNITDFLQKFYGTHSYCLKNQNSCTQHLHMILNYALSQLNSFCPSEYINILHINNLSTQFIGQISFYKIGFFNNRISNQQIALLQQQIIHFHQHGTPLETASNCSMIMAKL